MKPQIKLLKNLLTTAAAATAIQSLSIIADPVASHASTIQIGKCPTSGSISEATFKATINGSSAATAGCYAPAASYEINIYEVGLCTQNPTSGGSFSRSGCVAIYSNQSGSGYLNIASSTIDLSNGYVASSDSTSRSYAYVILNPTIKTSGSYSTSTATYYSGDSNYMGWSDGRAGAVSKLTGPGSTFSYTVSSGDGRTACYGGASLNSYDISYAFLNGAESVPAVAGGACNGVTKVALSMPTSAPLTAASRLNLRFNVSEYALIVQSYNSFDFPAKAVPGFALGFPLIDIRSQ